MGRSAPTLLKYVLLCHFLKYKRSIYSMYFWNWFICLLFPKYIIFTHCILHSVLLCYRSKEHECLLALHMCRQCLGAINHISKEGLHSSSYFHIKKPYAPVVSIVQFIKSSIKRVNNDK